MILKELLDRTERFSRYLGSKHNWSNLIQFNIFLRLNPLPVKTALFGERALPSKDEADSNTTGLELFGRLGVVSHYFQVLISVQLKWVSMSLY